VWQFGIVFANLVYFCRCCAENNLATLLTNLFFIFVEMDQQCAGSLSLGVLSYFTTTGPGPQIVSYNATSSRVRSEIESIIFLSEKRSSLPGTTLAL
jgi:hypothetical protein